MEDIDYFLNRFSRIYPFSHCIWRIGEAVRQLSYLPFKSPCLDLGCGDGTYMRVLLDRVDKPDELIGIDPQAIEIERARAKNIYDKLIIGCSNSIPLSDSSVNMVFSNSVVEHIQDKAGTIKEVARLLKPGGRYVFSAPSENFVPGLKWKKWFGNFWPNLINWKFKHYWLQSPAEWKKDLADGGLELVSWKYSLTPENLAAWERNLLFSYVQHLPAKILGRVLGYGLSRQALEKRRKTLAEPFDLLLGGNLILCAEKRQTE